MRLNKYLFNRVNNKERERGQRSVVWLKRGQPCLHHLHVLSTVFSWRPFSSFSLWIILLPSDSRCFLLLQSNRFSFYVVFGFAWFLCNRCFVVIWGDSSSLRLAMVFAWVFCLILHGWIVRQQLGCGVFAEWLWSCVYLLSGHAAHDFSSLAVHELSRLAVHELSGLVKRFASLKVKRSSSLAVKQSSSLAVKRSTSLAVKQSSSLA